MTGPHPLPEPVTVSDHDLLIAALAIGAGALLINGLLFIGAVTLISVPVRWLRRR